MLIYNIINFEVKNGMWILNDNNIKCPICFKNKIYTRKCTLCKNKKKFTEKEKFRFLHLYSYLKDLNLDNLKYWVIKKNIDNLIDYQYEYLYYKNNIIDFSNYNKNELEHFLKKNINFKRAKKFLKFLEHNKLICKKCNGLCSIYSQIQLFNTKYYQFENCNQCNAKGYDYDIWQKKYDLYAIKNKFQSVGISLGIMEQRKQFIKWLQNKSSMIYNNKKSV